MTIDNSDISERIPGVWEIKHYSKNGLWHVPEHYFDGYPETYDNWRLSQSLFIPGPDGIHPKQTLIGLVGTPSDGPRQTTNFTFKFYNAFSEPVITMGPYEWTIKSDTTYYPGTDDAHWKALSASVTLQPGETCLVTFQFVTQALGAGPLFNYGTYNSRAGYIFKDTLAYDVNDPTYPVDEQSMREPYVIIFEEGDVPESGNTALDIVGETPVVSNVRWINLYGQTVTEVPFYQETHIVFTFDRVNYGATAHKTLMPRKSWHTRKYLYGMEDLSDPSLWFYHTGDPEQSESNSGVLPTIIDKEFGYTTDNSLYSYNIIGYARNGRLVSSAPISGGYPWNVPTDYEMYSGVDLIGDNDPTDTFRSSHIANTGTNPYAEHQNYVIKTEQGDAGYNSILNTGTKYPRFVTFGASCELTRPHINAIGTTGNGFNGSSYFADGWGDSVGISYSYSNTGQAPAIVDTLTKYLFPSAGHYSGSTWIPSGTFDISVVNDTIPPGGGTTTFTWTPQEPVNESVGGSPLRERFKYSDYYGQTHRARVYGVNYGFADFPEIGNMYYTANPEPIKLHILLPFTINIIGENYSRWGPPDWTTELAPTNSTSEYYYKSIWPNWERLIIAHAETSGKYGMLSSASWNYAVGVADALTATFPENDAYANFNYYSQPELASGFAVARAEYATTNEPVNYQSSQSANLYIKVLYSLGGANSNTITVTAIDELGRVATDSIEFTFPPHGGWNIGTIPGNPNGGWSV